MNPHAPIIPPGQHPLSALPPIAEETGRHFAQFPPAVGAAAAGPPLATAMPPAFDASAALDQLATLDTFAAAVADARSRGGPTAALRALIERPIKVGPFTLQKCSLFTFLFLNNIKSPYVGGGIVKDLDLAKALLAFTDPEAAAIYLDFHGEEVIVDFPQLTRDAYRIAGKLDKTGIAAATDWIASQIGGIGQLIPTGEEAGNFQTPAGTTPPPEMEVSPVLRAGSSFSSTS